MWRKPTIRPPWDSSGFDPPPLKRSSDLVDGAQRVDPVPVPPPALRQHLAALKGRLGLTLRRVEKTLGVVSDASALARQRTAEIESVRLAGMELDECMSWDERRLVQALNRVGREAKATSTAMSSVRALLSEFEKLIGEALATLDAEAARLDERLMIESPHSMDLSQLTASAQAWGTLDAESHSACKNALAAARKYSVRLESARADKTIRLRTLRHTSPSRKCWTDEMRSGSPSQRSAAAGRLNEACEVDSRAVDESPMHHLFKGSFRIDSEIPQLHRSKVLRDSYSQGDLLMRAKVRRQEAAAARAAARTILDVPRQQGGAGELRAVVTC